MKKYILSALTLAVLVFNGIAAEKADHDHEHAKAGPTGGRLITKVEPHAEFFIADSKKIEIRFVDDDNKILPPGSQVVTVTMGQRNKPSQLRFAREGDKLVSDKTIPEGNKLPTVVQIREKEGAKPVNVKFNLDLSECSECKHKEYACVCDHDHD